MFIIEDSIQYQVVAQNVRTEPNDSLGAYHLPAARQSNTETVGRR